MSWFHMVAEEELKVKPLLIHCTLFEFELNIGETGDIVSIIYRVL